MEQKEFSLVNHIGKIDNFLDYRIVKNLMKYINYIDNKKYFDDARIVGRNNQEQLQKKVRDTKNFALTNLNDSMTDIHWSNFLLFAFRKVMRQYQEHYSGLAVKDIVDMQILKYDKGGHYIPHVDDHFDIPRTISIIYRLNNDFKGGDLVFFDRNQEMLRIKPAPNSLIIWPSNFLYPHSVEPVTEGRRWSIVAWAR